METYLSIYLISLSILVIITSAISVRAFINWQTPGARTLGMLMVSMTVWAGFYLLEIMHPALSVKIFARKMLYLGMALFPAFWLGFALRYSGFGTWWSKRGRVFLLAIPGGIASLLGLTNESHALIWTSHSNTHGAIAPLTLEYGPGFWFFTAIAYGLIVTAFAVYIIAYYQSDRTMRIKTGLMLAGALLTLVVNTSFLFLDNDLNLDPTPLSFALSAPLIAFGYFRFGVLGLFPLAAPLVVENLKDAIIIVNRDDEITDLNQTAMRLLGLKNLKENLPFFSLLPQADELIKIWDTPNAGLKLEWAVEKTVRSFDVQVIPIHANGNNLIGRVVVFHDVTHEQALLKAEQRRAQQLFLLEETGRRIADSFDQKEILQRAVEAIIERFQYPEAAISVLTEGNMLETTVIAGVGYPGYETGYKQPLGAGIIGHTAAIKQTYISNNLGADPFYYSTFEYFGSAVCTPIWKQGNLFGVLYVESTDTNAFDDIDVKTLEALANQISASLQRADLYAQTQTDLRTLSTIQDISKLVAGSLDLETISQTVVKSLKDSFGYNHVSIYFLKDDYLHLAAQVGYPEEMIISNIHISQGVAGKTIRTKSIHFIEDITKEKTFLKADNQITSEICVPLLKKDVVLGILNVESTPQRQLKRADVELLTTIAGPIAVAVDNARLHTELKRMATTDAVTGLSNRHVFEQALAAEVERAQRSGFPLSLVIFDIDFFKEYNDKWGHPAGDVRLKAVADIIKLNLRKYDIAARYGGDEFAIILSDCSQENALAFAERLQQGTQTGAAHLPHNETGIPGHTLSIGIATFPHDAIESVELLISADHAAMRAKQQGRNRIKLASDYETT